MSDPAFTGSGAPDLVMLMTGDEFTVVVAATPLTGAVWFESIWYEPLVITVPFASGVTTCATSCTLPEALAGRLPIAQVTMPPASVPPPLADTKVVFPGTVSVIVTPVASDVPVLEYAIV